MGYRSQSIAAASDPNNRGSEAISVRALEAADADANSVLSPLSGNIEVTVRNREALVLLSLGENNLYETLWIHIFMSVLSPSNSVIPIAVVERFPQLGEQIALRAETDNNFLMLCTDYASVVQSQRFGGGEKSAANAELTDLLKSLEIEILERLASDF